MGKGGQWEEETTGKLAGEIGQTNGMCEHIPAGAVFVRLFPPRVVLGPGRVGGTSQVLLYLIAMALKGVFLLF